ncbi:hypothetical protein P4U05_20520 [Bacillus paranthracis]|uniref:hypothetical protein n=1 Tax=Bacillus cereus group TaxID=86661 RepID=UPI000200F1F2|nr:MULTISPECIES: hypothetical protein [Bacillus cereus group]ADY24849.1 hypothetical protein YBT020_28464 [Bacillus thuringiensis serovar finitimus YBT-020]MRC74006.1 hypothetical protein [Bacillus thuringiensis]OTX71541.1 hypothetical protein BK722_12225 [Bacillus thuringiensis serovar finitimus]MEC3360536.1 hypothetical protein [Bacillus paranthracis]MED0786615.1 hypothetical protein [Bacillus paranthracis]
MFMMFRACQSINTRYLVKTYMWGILIYLFFRWVIPPYETGMITLMTVNLIFFPLTRIFAHEIKSFFFSDTVFMMTDKAWVIYLFLKASVLGWFFVMTPIFGPIGFVIVLLRFWKLEREKKKYMQQRKRNFTKS